MFEGSCAPLAGEPVSHWKTSGQRAFYKEDSTRGMCFEATTRYKY